MMEIIDTKLYDYVWNNINKVKFIFPKKAYDILGKLREEKDKERFSDTLGVILDFDHILLEKIENQYEDIETMSIEEVTNALNIRSYDDFNDKKIYIKRALYLVDDYKKQDEIYSDLINNLAKLYYKIGLYENAKPLYLKSLDIRKRLLDNNHTKVVTSYNNLARLYQKMGSYKELNLVLQEILKITEYIVGKYHPYTDSVYDNLAKSYLLKGDYDRSKYIYQKLLTKKKKSLGENHPDVATIYYNLAELYELTGNNEKAEILYQDSLIIREDVLKINHSDTFKSYNSLANLYQKMGEYKKSEYFYKKSLKLGKDILIDSTPDTAKFYNNLAELYRLMKNYNKAKPFYEKALKILKNILGENHPNIATTYNNLGLLYQSVGDYEKSESLYKKSLNITKNILGENHPNTINTYSNIAGFYKSIGDYDKSEEFYLKSIRIIEEVLDENYPNASVIYNNIATFYSSYKNYDKSIGYYFKALKLGEESLSYSHPEIMKIHKNIAIFSQEVNKEFFLNNKNSNLSLRIKKVEVESFKQYNSKFEIYFSKKINIIIGQNAIGKTTLLQAIILGLLKDGSADEKTNYSKYITKGEIESKIIISHNNSEKLVKILKDRREIDNNYFIPFVLAYGSNFFTDYKESDPIVQKILDETITRDFAHTIFLEHTDKFWNPLSILRNLAISKHEKAKEKKSIVFDTLNNFLMVEDYQLVADHDDNTRFHFIKGGDKTPLGLSELSEGYRGNVLLITDMLIKILGVGWTPKTIEGIVLIDEFDRHLHPKWQSKLVNILLESFPNIQFIMTTHNPMSILDRNPNEIIILKETAQGIQAVTGRGTKTIDVSTILLEYFDVEATISDSMREKIDAFNQLKMKKELTSKEHNKLNELEAFLGQTVASNFIYNRKYLRFLEYIRDHTEIDFDRYQKIDDDEMKQLLEDFGDFFYD